MNYLEIRNSEEPVFTIFGAPMDWSSSFKAGSRFAPDELRKYSVSIESFSFYQKKDLLSIPLRDNGDIELIPGDILNSLKKIKEFAFALIKKGIKPVMIGGDHLTSLGVIEAISEEYKDTVVIQFDAHADLRDDYLGLKYSHATVMKRVKELPGIKDIIQIGARSCTQEELNESNLFSINDTKQINKIIKGKNIYITIDIDVFDPSEAPGVSNPEPGGISFKEFINFLLSLEEDINLTGFDVVEINPENDISGITCVLGATIIREVIIKYGKGFQA